MRNEETSDGAGERPLLSKWWKTASAQAATERAKQNRKDKIQAMRKTIEDRRAALDKEIWEEGK